MNDQLSPLALAAFEDMIRKDPVRGLMPDYYLVKLESFDPANPQFRDALVDANWQIFLAGWNANRDTGTLGPAALAGE